MGEDTRDRAGRLAAIDAVLASKSDEVRQFVAQYRGSREGSVARFCCDLIDAIEGAIVPCPSCGLNPPYPKCNNTPVRTWKTPEWVMCAMTNRLSGPPQERSST